MGTEYEKTVKKQKNKIVDLNETVSITALKLTVYTNGWSTMTLAKYSLRTFYIYAYT